MTDKTFIEDVNNIYELSYYASEVQLPGKQINRMAAIILEFSEVAEKARSINNDTLATLIEKIINDPR